MKIPAGYAVPRFYGVAYCDPSSRHAYCYPVPLHWLMRWVRSAWYWIRFPSQSKWEKELQYARQSGYNEGWQAGYKTGDSDARLEVAGFLDACVGGKVKA